MNQIKIKITSHYCASFMVYDNAYCNNSKSHSLNVETKTETINFKTETETQMEVVETIKDETREICSRLQFSKLSRPRLFETMEISDCRD